MPVPILKDYLNFPVTNLKVHTRLHTYQYKYFSVPLVHGIVHDRVDAAVGHRQPVETKIHVLSKPGLWGEDWTGMWVVALLIPCPSRVYLVLTDLHYFRIEVRVYKIRVVWKPADSKDRGNCSEHLHHLHSKFREFTSLIRILLHRYFQKTFHVLEPFIEFYDRERIIILK